MIFVLIQIFLSIALALSIILILFSLLRQSSAQEALSSISGGSQQLFINRKVKLSKSILVVFLSVLSTLIISLLITVRILSNL